MAEKYFAALSWPFMHKPAVALVIKVEWDAKDPNSQHKARIIEETEAMSLPDMFRRCCQLQKEYDIKLWHGDAMNEAMVSLLFQGAKGKSIPLTIAPYVDDPDATTLYLQAIRELTRGDNKVLWFGEGSSLPGHLTNLPKDKPIDITKFPPVTALGYAAAALYLWLQLEYEKKPKTFFERIIEQVESTQNDWDSGLFGYGGDDEDEESFFFE